MRPQKGIGLHIRTFGGLQIQLDGEPLTGLASHKVEALLVYLAANPRPHPREVLADLLWEELPQRRALDNLRGSLYSLRKQLSPYLSITRDLVTIQSDSPLRLDVLELEQHLEPFIDQEGVRSTAVAEELEAVFELYRGDFLAGFFVTKAHAFEAWVVQERERLHHLVLDALRDAVAFDLESGTYKRGIQHARRLLQLEPLVESAHRQLMRLLAYSGQRQAALQQYEICRRLIKDELGVEPEPETIALFEQIQAGSLPDPTTKPVSAGPLEVAQLPEGTVTFLFTDIEGSTTLLKRLQIQYADLLAQQRQIMRAALVNWHGEEVDSRGDSMFLSFQRANDAVAAAVEVQEALAAHTWPEGVEVRVRMGMHTGEPWLVQEGYIGLDIHRAARIAHAGHGGQVLLSETTAALTVGDLPDGVTLRDLGSHHLKDMPRAEHIHQLEIAGLPAAFPPLVSADAPPADATLEVQPIRVPAFLAEEAEELAPPKFVGRERELARLDSFLERALANQGSVVFITGGPGMGKTALIEAFARRATTAYPELLVVGGSCNAYTSGGDPYLPFRQALSLLTGEVEARWKTGAITREQARRLWETLPLTARTLLDHGQELVEVMVPGQRLLGRLATATPAEEALRLGLQKLIRQQSRTGDREERKPLDEDYTRWLCSLAGHKPVLLWVDDLQWADKASIDLLFHLGRRVSSERILIVGAYRREELAPGTAGRVNPLAKVLAELKREHGDVWIELAQTSPEEGRRFVDAFLDLEPNHFSESFQDTFFRHTAGHPLFTVELLRELRARQGIVQDPHGKWVETPELNWDVLPVRVEGVIEERIGRLNPDTQALLSAAAVEGERFTVQVLAGIIGQDEGSIIDRLADELGAHYGLVEEEGAIDLNGQRLYRYRFRHVLFQQYLYAHLSPVQLERLHARVGGALESLYGDHTEEIAPRLVFHFGQAQDSSRAVSYALQAGDLAARLGASQEAIRFYDRGLEESEHLDLDQRSIQSGVLLERLGDVYLQSLSRHEEALAYYNRFLEQAEAREDRTRAQRKIATIYALIGEPDRAQDHFEAALEGLGADAESAEAGKVHGGLAFVYIYQNRLDEAERHARIARRQGEAFGDDLGLAHAHNAFGHIATYRGALGKAQEHFKAGLAISRRMDDLPRTAKMYNNLGEISRLMGDLETAISYLKEGLPIARRVGDKRDEAAMLTTTGDLYLDQGRWAEAVELLEEALPVAMDSGVVHRIVEAQWLLGSAYRQAGDLKSASDQLAGAEQTCLETGLLRYLVQIYLDQMRLAADLGDLEQGERQLERAAEAAGEAPGDEVEGQLRWGAGHLCEQRQEWDEAIRHYQAAMVALEQANSPVKAAKVRLALGRACLSRGARGDAGRARDHLRDARLVFERIDAQVYLEEVERMRKDLAEV